VGVDFQKDGIVVDKHHFPILRMDWAKGDVLAKVLREHHDNPHVVAAILRSFLSVTAFMEARGAAHGDLQADNMVWDGATLRLIDYDGMYVPVMRPGRGDEKGHRNYQHPGRDASTFGPAMDRFSILSICVSLLAISRNPDLYKRFAVTDENILFVEEDYRNPAASKAFHAVASIPELNATVAAFARICTKSVNAVPTLADFRAALQGLQTPGSSASPLPSAVQRPAPACLLDDQEDFLQSLRGEHFDTPVLLVGRMTQTRRTKNDSFRAKFRDAKGIFATVHFSEEAATAMRSNDNPSRDHASVRATLHSVRRNAADGRPELVFMVSRHRDVKTMNWEQARNAVLEWNATHRDSRSSGGSNADARPPPATPTSLPQEPRPSVWTRLLRLLRHLLTKELSLARLLEP
jgi:hypothetical protein